MAQKTDTIRISFTDLTDDGLAHVRRTYERAIEDNAREARHCPAWIRKIRDIQLSRLRLRMRYGAVDNHVGTPHYDRCYRHDEPPTYKLATEMDHRNWQLSRSYVLDWDTATTKLPHRDPRRKNGTGAMDDPRTRLPVA